MISDRLDSNEKVVTVIRKHWFMFAVQAFLLAIAASLPLIAAAFIPADGVAALENMGISGTFFVFLYALWVLVIWNLTFVAWTTYYLDVWIVTNRRIIDIDQVALFRRRTTTLMLEKIQDVTVEMDGIFATLLGFGKLVLHTAGAEDPDIVISFAAHPQYAKERILENQRRALEGENRPSTRV